MNEPTGERIDIEFSVVSGSNDQLLFGCIESVLQTMEQSRYTWRITATSNRPGSDLATPLRDRFRDITVIENHTARGFAQNHNAVLRRSTARYVWLLNDDLVILPGTVDRVTAFMDEPLNDRVAVVSPRLLNPDGTLQPSTYSFPSMPQILLSHSGLRGSPLMEQSLSAVAPLFRPRPGQSRFWGHDRTITVDTLRGACVAVRSEAVRDVGEMVEVSLVGGEETEWHRRFREKGWKVVFMHDASVIHYGSQTVGPAATDHLPEYLKGSLYYFHTDRPAVLYKIFCLSLSVLFSARAVWAWVRRDRKSLELMRRYLDATSSEQHD
jgi:GT2 family glycosyltransferase